MIGKTLAHYHITGELGRGGMGEVYQAKDRKLGRDVAIKLLPEEFARDADRVARFQREAKLLASLNHPNIAAIYGLEESDKTNFLVMELVEGETLADQINKGPRPVEDSLKLALQIAEALEAAHEKGVIHRDLKPANIRVTSEGKVKVLDFGLAKAFAGEQAELNLSNSPTLSNAATQQGIILGTAAYMSPEQARGKAVDKKTDIWAFGCVLFEMLTGRAVFPGQNVTDILAAVIRAEPEWSSLPANLHWRLRELLERCLKKDAKERYHDISDVKMDIQRVMTDPGGLWIQPVMTAKPGRGLRSALPWIAAAIVLTAIIAGLVGWNLRIPNPPQVVRFAFDFPEDPAVHKLIERAIAVSPDGTQIVYTAKDGICLRSIDKLEARLIKGTDSGCFKPFFSPDGKSIGYWSGSDAKLKRISINGGVPQTIGDEFSEGAYSWGKDNTIVYGKGKSLKRVSANGGTPELLFEAKAELKANFTLYPQILPGGKHVLLTTYPPFKMQLLSLESGSIRELFGGVQAQYIPTGHIIYIVGYDLFAVPFDLKSLAVTGEPAPLLEGVYRMTAAMQFAVSESGTIVYMPGNPAAAETQRILVWVKRDGTEERIGAAPNTYSAPSISPDGTKLALEVASGRNEDIWIYDLMRGIMTPLTFGKSDGYPLWTHDGRRIVFCSDRDVEKKVYWKSADGMGKDELLGSISGSLAAVPSSWSEDGKTLILTNANGLNLDIGALTIEGDRQFRSLLHEKFMEGWPHISPDGRWMAYESDESGLNQICVRPFPDVGSGGPWQISTDGGGYPLWSPDGRELFYINGNAVMAVSVKAGSGFSYGKPEILFKGDYSSSGSRILERPWDISPDGKKFLTMKDVQSTNAADRFPRKINITLNWFEELKQRMPTK